jgi:hemin uptake protein HemP
MLDDANANDYCLPVSASGSPPPRGKTAPGQSPDRTAPRGAPRQVKSEALLGPAGELVIEHAGREYRLRVTQNGKLILTA